MGGSNNRQRKSSSGFMSVFSMFKSNKKNRGGYYDSYDDGTKARKMWHSDEDWGRWGVAEPGIDIKAEAFIARHKQRVSESERFEIDPAATDA
ncbi:hypothetical protein QN277_021778 [Acacia crassicarpa]|uniref:Uncharacterized protein n=1 Tax=Acacia crassicarpa TaxID=499986 RepID=A0AAE1JMH4_9FABA|nr:hypothetical protein QN277_021778 [Acacia crassicarpa]